MRRIILDTDLSMGEPGSEIDDGFALALAVADPDLSVELITTVSGNTDLDTATELTEALLRRLDRSIPLVAGADRPLRRPAPHPAPSGRSGPAAEAIVEAVRAAPGELTVVAIGPLTNVAAAVRADPGLATGLREVVVMGGIYLGSTNQLDMPGEFNTWVDPDALAVLLASGVPLRLVGLDVTRQVRLDRADAETMRRSTGDFAAFAGQCTLAWIDALDAAGRGEADPAGSCALHDPLAVAVVSHPELVTFRPAVVAVETVGEVARGVTIADFRPSAGQPTCEVAVSVDAAGFRSLLLNRLASV